MSLFKPLAYVFPTVEALQEHAARLAEAARQASAAASEGARVTAPASRRAAELGIDLSSFATGELVTVKMVEAAARNGAAAPPRDLPSPLDAPSGVERVAVIGAGLGATQVIDIFGAGTADRRQQAVGLFDDDESLWADVGGRGPGRRRHAAVDERSPPRAASTPP